MGTDSGFMHKDLTEAIIGAAMRVLNALKAGLVPIRAICG